MDSLKNRFGKKLKELREARGYASQGAFADSLEIDQSRVSRWETGKELPDPAYRKVLMDKLNAPDLFDFDSGPAVFLNYDKVMAYIMDLEQKAKELAQIKSDPAWKAFESERLRLSPKQTKEYQKIQQEEAEASHTTRSPDHRKGATKNRQR